MIINQNNKSKGWFSYRVIPFIFVHLISWVECYICKYILCNILPKWKMKYPKERLRAVSPLRNWSNSENHPRRSTSKTTKILRENKHTRTIFMFSIQVLGIVCLLSNSPQSKCIVKTSLFFYDDATIPYITFSSLFPKRFKMMIRMEIDSR